MSRKVVLTCAVTGGGRPHPRHGAIPITPAQIADACLEAAKEGASGPPISRAPSVRLRVGRPLTQFLRQYTRPAVTGRSGRTAERRNGRSEPAGVPILDLQSISRR